jgi:putative Holliday junction resolvase
MRYLGFDLGSKTLGISLSDSIGIIASSHSVIRYENYDELLSKLKSIIIEFNITEVVLGYPLNMNGTESIRSKETLVFKSLLETKLNLIVHLQDERLSTTEAERILINNNTSRKKRKKVIDKLASTIILQTYLDKRSK